MKSQGFQRIVIGGTDREEEGVDRRGEVEGRAQ